MTMVLLLYVAIFAAALAALLARSRLTNHLLLGLAGAFGVAYGFQLHGLFGVILPALLLMVASVQAGSVLVANKAARFNREEEEMMRGPLSGLGRDQARRLLDQGFWMDGRPGDGAGRCRRDGHRHADRAVTLLVRARPCAQRLSRRQPGRPPCPGAWLHHQPA